MNSDKNKQLGNKIIKKISKEDLNTAIHRSWNSCMVRLFSKYPKTKYIANPQHNLINSGLTIAMLNRVWGTSLRPENADQAIAEVKQYYKPIPFTWQVDPWDKPRNLPEMLEKQGLKREETPGMAAEIGELIEPSKPEDFRYLRVNTQEEVETYARLMVKAYGMPEFGWEYLSGCLSNLGVVDDFRHYIGYLGDVPVATSSILYSDGVAGLYNVATLPEARGKGVGGMISYVPFVDALALGYRYGILHSSRLGFSVYRRLGFAETCRLVRYVWRPEGGS